MKISIIGAGIVGMSTAYHLNKQGADVTIYEKDRAFAESSFARSCGGFRSQFFTETNIDMSRYSVDFIKNQTDVDFVGNGYLMLFDTSKEQDCNYSYKLQTSKGASTKLLTPEETAQRFPFLNTKDLYMSCMTNDESEGWIDPVSLHKWYRENTNCKIIFNDGTLVDHDDADAVVITSGCWSGDVGKHFDINIPVIPHKHTVFNVSTTKPVIKELPLVADLITGVYLRPEGEGYIVGYDGNGSYDSDDLEPDWNSWEEVWMHLYHRFPNIFDEAKMTGAWAGYYDQSKIDNNAIIDKNDKFYFATGFTGRGLMHSPAVGLTLSQMVLGEDLLFDISEYKIDRTPNIEKYVI
tara:strand:- start:3 stop:1055 length:1053 start_codon:yes stop_codon:yes gene_type:complete